ncbi:MAG: class I SAM-dependent methyltransferase [Nitrosopumilaceae archaeon]
MKHNIPQIKFKNKNNLQKIDETTYTYFDKQQSIKLFDINKEQYKSFREGLETKNWQQVAAELYAESNPWLFKIITDQNRSDFLFLLDIKKDDLALDLGAGWGQVTIPLSRFCNVVAVEGNMEKIEIMKTIAKQENRDNIQFVVANIADKIFEPDQFELVIFNGVLEWIGSFSEGDPVTLQQEALDEAYRVLKPSGTLYIGIENKYGLKYLLGEKDDHTGLTDHVYLNKETLKSVFKEKTGKELRVFTHGKNEYEKMITNAGFSHVRFFGDLPDYKLLHTMVDLTNDKISSYVANNLDFVDEYNGYDGTVSKYNEKLRHLYNVLSDQLTDLYPSYSIIATK